MCALQHRVCNTAPCEQYSPMCAIQLLVCNRAPCVQYSLMCPIQPHTCSTESPMCAMQLNLYNRAICLQHSNMCAIQSRCAIKPYVRNPSTCVHYSSMGAIRLHVSNTSQCEQYRCACPHELHITHMCTSQPHMSNMAVIFHWRLINTTKSACVYCAFYAVTRDCTSFILHICIHLTPSV